MSFYKYFCEANGKTIEVCHPVTVKLKTWAAVSLLAKMPCGDTSPQAPVVRLVSEALPLRGRFRGIDKEKTSKKLEL